ncbi:MAG: filamentous hemagglutinin N-terminal domain-containing protein [Cyanobacteria bacterium J06626_18]
MNIWQNVRLVAPGLACVFMAGNGVLLLAGSAHGQIVPDNTLGTESSVVNSGDLIDLIEGGATRGSGLFHSFEDFNVDAGQQVYFANPVGIENILSRVTGLNPSEINGLLGVDGPANLFFLNPNGIVFGPDAQLDVDGAFLATTSDRFQFADGTEFRATDPNEAPLVTVNIPVGLQLGPDSPAALVSEADLEAGSDLTLSAGSVTSTGALTAPSGAIRVEGRSGNVQVQSVEAQSAVLSASENLVLEESRLVTEGDLSLVAEQTVRVRDSKATPFLAAAGGDLLVQGTAGIDILALNHLDVTPFQSGGNLQLVSDGIVSGDTHFDSGGGFQILDTAGNPGEFVSLYDPIIRADGDVSFGAYTGASLLVEATGDIETTGSITVTEPDEGSGVALLDDNAAVILRAGVDPMTLNDNFPDNPPLVITEEGTDFTKTPGGGGNLTIGDDITAEDTVGNEAGYIELEATGDITLNGSLTAVDNSTILLQGNTVIGNNSVTLTADIVDFDTTVDLDGRSLTVSGDEIDFGGEVTPGGGSLTLAPLSDDRDITLGRNNPTGALDLTAAEIDFLDSGGFSQITIGSTDGTGTINLRALGDNDFQSDVTIAGGGELLGPNNRSNWTTTGANAGVLDLMPGQAGGEITFQNFAAIDAGDQQDFLIGTSGADVFTVEADPPGTPPNAQGERVTINGTTFEDIERINALGGNDTVVFNGPRFDGPIAGGAGDLTIRGDEINFGNDASEAVSGSGDLFIEPISSSRRILIGATNDPTKDLELTSSDIQRLEDGFDSINFSTQGDIIVRNSAVTFQDPLILDAGETVRIDRSLTVTEDAAITLQGDRIDINANVTARSGNIDVFGNNVTVDNATLNTSGVEGNDPGGNIRIGSAIAGNDLQPADSIRLNANNATLNAGDDPTDGGVITLAAPSFAALSYNEDRLLARQVILLVPNPIDSIDPNENGEAIFQNVTIRAANGDGGLTVNGITAPFGFLPDPNAEDSFFFSDVFIETLPNDTPIALVATDQFTVEDLMSSLEVSPRFSEFRAGNAFVVEAGDAIVALGDFRIATVGPLGDSAIADLILADPNLALPVPPAPGSTLTVGSVSSTNGSISLASIGSLNVEGALSAADDLNVASIETLTVQGAAEATNGNITFNSADNLNIIGTNANITTGGDTTFRSAGTLNVSRSDSVLTTSSGTVSFDSGETLTISGNNFDITAGGDAASFTSEEALSASGDNSSITTNGGTVSITSGDTLTVSGNNSNIRTDGGTVELNADNAITLDRNINSSPPVPITTQGGDIRVLASQGNITITSDLTSRNAANGDAFSELQIEASDGTVTLSGATLTAANPANADPAAFAGNILIDASDEIQVLNGSNLSTDGRSGRIFIGPNDPDANTLVPTQVTIADSSLSTTNGVTGGSADAGNIQISSDRVDVSGSTIQSDTIGSGNAGTISLTARDGGDVAVVGNSTISSGTSGAGNAGTISLTAQNGGNVELSGNSTISSDTSGAGNAGSISLTAQTDGEVIIETASQVTTDVNSATATGTGGDITILAPNVTITGAGTQVSANTNSDVITNTQGQGGSISITGESPTQSITVSDRAQVTANTTGRAQGGSVTLSAPNQGSIDVSGATVAAITEQEGNAGEVTLTGNTLTVVNGGILAQALQNGRAGDIVVNATDAVTLSGPLNANTLGGIIASSGEGGTGGSIRVNTPQLAVENGAAIAASATGTGDAGSVTINATTVDLSNSSEITTQTDAGTANTDGIQLQNLATLSVENSLISASTQSGTAGGINIDATDSVTLRGRLDAANPGGIGASSGNGGSGGSIRVTTPQLLLEEGAAVAASASGTGNAGSVTVDATTVGLSSGSEITTETAAGNADMAGIQLQNLATLSVANSLISASTQSGTAGGIDIDTSNSIALRGQFDTDTPGGIRASSGNEGTGGSINVSTPQLTVENGAAVAASATGTGDAGSVTIDAMTVSLRSGGEITAETEAGSTPLGIQFQNLETLAVTNGLISASTQSGEAGNITIDAANAVTLNGLLEEENSGGISASSRDGGLGGNIVLSTRQLITQNGAAIAATGTGTGAAGTVEVTAETVEVTGTGSTIGAFAEAGVAGSITVNTDTLDVLDNGSISVSSDGVAGGLDITADFIVLENGSLTAETGATGDADSARIRLDLTNEEAPDNILWLQDESLISARANGNANGGNIEITGVDFILADFPSGPDGSDIVANAVDGDGGNIDIEALGVIGIQVRPERTPLNDITASSEAGVQGTVTVNTLATDPDSGLAELAFEFIDASDQATNQCVVDSGEASSVRVAGRGGLPTMPTDVLGATIAPSDEDWVTLDSPPEPEEAMQSTLTEEAAFAAGVESDRPQAVCHRAYQASQESI